MRLNAWTPNRSNLTTLPTQVLAEMLLGQKLVCADPLPETSGLIVECEAYLGVNDRACHAFSGRRTPRMEILWGDAGYAYVYCMHTHWLLNVTTQQNGVPECVLVRALFPLSGIETMVARRGGRPQRELMSGPGRLTQAMGIDKRHLGIDLLCPSSPLRLERAHDDEVRRAGIDEASQIERGPRIGIGYAGNDATLPLRFRLR